jgi:hypothetical protein
MNARGKILRQLDLKTNGIGANRLKCNLIKLVLFYAERLIRRKRIDRFPLRLD